MPFKNVKVLEYQVYYLSINWNLLLNEEIIGLSRTGCSKNCQMLKRE